MSAIETDDQKALALDLLLDAWDQALAAGVEPEMLASVGLYASFVDMVDRFGAEAVAEFCATLPARVRAGEFTLSDEDAAADFS